MRVLCYIRPWSEAQFRLICEFAFPGAETRFISDFLGVGTERLQERFYVHHDAAPEPEEAGIDAETCRDVITRCRLLRNLPQPEARRLVAAMWRVLDEIFDEADPDVAVSSTVDSYVLDLVRLQCRARGVAHLGFLPMFIDGYFMVTSRGEYRWLRQPDEREIERVTDRLTKDDYEPGYVTRPASPLRSSMRIWNRQSQVVLRWLYYSMRLMTTSDPLCYHYLSSKIVERSNLSLWPQPWPGDRDWEAGIVASQGSPRIYVPLQYFPESTVDYWCKPVDVIDYYEVLYRAIEILGEDGIRVIAKEHPGAMGRRPGNVYRRLKSFDNLVLVPPEVSSNDLLRQCEAVLVWTGTVGVEAALRGVPVIHFGAPYYVHGDRFLAAPKVEDLHAVAHRAVTEERAPITRDEQRSLVEHLLAGALPGTFSDRYNRDFTDPDVVDSIKAIAASVREVDLDCFRVTN